MEGLAADGEERREMRSRGRRRRSKSGDPQQIRTRVKRSLLLAAVVAAVVLVAVQLSPDGTRTKTSSPAEGGGPLFDRKKVVGLEGWGAHAAEEGEGEDAEAKEGAGSLAQPEPPATATGTARQPLIWQVQVVKETPHDRSAFTQGIFYHEKCTTGTCRDIFYESTGLRGEWAFVLPPPPHPSPHARERAPLLVQGTPPADPPRLDDSPTAGRTSVRIIDVATGVVEAKTSADSVHFGEGLTAWAGELFQLTWQTGHTLVYDRWTLEARRETSTDLKDGWGLTNDSDHLIATDSGSVLHFLDPETLRTTRRVEVRDGEYAVRWLNELEYIEGEVWANVWQRDCIARIDPETGEVTGWIHALNLTQRERAKQAAMLGQGGTASR